MTIKTRKYLIFLLSLICFTLAFMCFGLFAEHKTYASTSAEDVDYALVLTDYTLQTTSGLDSITDPNGKDISWDSKGVFMPKVAGDYILSYGGQNKILRVLRDNPEVSFVYESAFKTAYGTGEILTLPKATITSVIGNYDNYTVEINVDGELIANVHSSQINRYSLTITKSGNYVVSYKCTDNTSLKYSATDEHSFTVSNEPALFVNNFPSEISFGSLINIGAVYGIYNGTTYPAELIATLPSGGTEKITDISYTPTEKGEYKFTATVNMGGIVKTKEQTVNVVISSDSLLTKSYSIASTKSYVDLPNTSKVKGKSLYVQAQTNSAYTYYSKIIDLRNFDKNDSLINFIPYSDVDSTTSDEIKVTLIDVHNQNNQLTLKWWYIKSVSDFAYMSSYLNGKELGGIKNEDGAKAELRTYYGTVGFGCYFDSYNNGLSSRFFNLRYDYEENALYSLVDKGFYITGEGQTAYSSADSLDLIVDLNDPVMLGYANIWNGFTTGEVYLKIEFTSSQPTSAIYIESIAGEKFDQELLTNSRNDTCFIISSEYTELPDGAVGYKYTFPTIVKNMLFDTEVSVALFKGQTPVQFSGGFFVPAEAGEYKIVYSAKDNYGELIEKEFEFTVKTQPNTFIFDTPSNLDATLFTNYIIPEIPVLGGSGNFKVTKELYYNNLPMNSVNGAYFIDKVGEYKIVVTATDFLNYTDSREYVLNLDSDYISLELESNVIALRAGTPTVLPSASSFDFGINEAKDITLEIYAGSSLLKTFNDGEIYSYNVPENYSELKLIYYSAKGTARERVLEKFVKVLPKDYTQVSDFIITDEGITSLSLIEGIMFTATQDGKIKFPNALPADGLNFEFSVDHETLNNFDGVIIRLIDAKKSDLIVEFNFYDVGVTTGVAKVEVNQDGKLFSAKYSNANYKASTLYSGSSLETERRGYDGKAFYSFESYFDAMLGKLNASDGSEIASVSTLKDGRTFSGFTSGLVFVEFEFVGVKGDSKLFISKVANQAMSFNNEVKLISKNIDTMGPNLRYTDKMVNTRVIQNTEITVAASTAHDLIQSSCSSVKVTVTTPSGNRLISEEVLTESRKIILTEYGTYTIKYEASDYLEKKTTENFNIVVYDHKVPQITVNGTIESEYSVGTKISLPKAVVQDNYSENLTATIYVKTPSVNYEKVTTGSYTFKEKGYYLLVYSAEDSFGNLTRMTYTIFVK